ncbi:MAG: selenide, water dikinase SelD [Saprospiraceae bacterium]|nr:selenide, water dikinase SelD [Saprospiraceae bacterium]
MDEQRLTLYSHGSGCGCKIDPNILDRILAGNDSTLKDGRLLVGNDQRDDAAVLDLGDGSALISTTDFFMPIVDDPYDFGRIAAANAISDIYAMGGKPLIAVAILGWPVLQLAPELAGKVLAGARKICQEAGIVLAGGHSIDSVEPFFGLAVNGRVRIEDIKQNNAAREGDIIYLTKPLGVGIYSTANKLDRIRAGDMEKARDVMIMLNGVGEKLASHSWVHAMTDVTGFGLLGHLLEVCQASQVSAQLQFDDIPCMDREALDYYLRMQCVPAASERNWASLSGQVSPVSLPARQLLCDPQTSGGLLITIDPEHTLDFEALTEQEGLQLQPIGRIRSVRTPVIEVME